jgi:CubicO group peptidase (beta-lactamase class C family)
MHSLRLLTLVPLSLLCSLTVLRARAQGAQGNILTDEVDTFINQLLADWTSPGGAAVAVVKLNEQGMWNIETKGYGKATFNGTKVNENTRFSIGSNSKVRSHSGFCCASVNYIHFLQLFNILATGLLVNNETLSPRLSWTTKIASIVPFWGLEDPIATKQATIIDVMSHRTGMPRHDFHYKWSDDVPTIVGHCCYVVLNVSNTPLLSPLR